jgi:hypothetical protein
VTHPVRKLIFGDKFTDFDFEKQFPNDERLFRETPDFQGWGGHQEFFIERMRDAKPNLIIEVGSWKGKSALAMARMLGQLGREIKVTDEGEAVFPGTWAQETHILCVDTWLGATEFLERKDDPKRFGSLGMWEGYGYPQVYYQFLSNVVHADQTKRITPFPQTSTNAARFLRRQGVKSEMIYVDASHEYEDVLADLNAWWPILDQGGIMCGDDYCEYWSGVIKAVNEFFWDRAEVRTAQFQNPDGQAPSDYWWVVKK